MLLWMDSTGTLSNARSSTNDEFQLMCDPYESARLLRCLYSSAT